MLLVLASSALFVCSVTENPSAVLEDEKKSMPVVPTAAAFGDAAGSVLAEHVGNAVPKNPSNSSCPIRASREENNKPESEIKKEIQEIVDRLDHSSDPEHLLAAALLRDHNERALARKSLARAIQLLPANPLFAWHELLACSGSKDGSCDFEAVRAHAIAAGGSNGAVWMEIATMELSNGDKENAFTSLRRAISSPVFTIHYFDDVLLLERAYAATTDWPFNERVAAAFGLGAATLSTYSRIISQCKEPVSDARIWTDICAQLGAKMFDEGRTAITRALGLALQDTAAQRGDDEEMKLRVRKRKDQFHNYYSQFANMDAQNLMFNDERVLRNYLDDGSTYGEFEAHARLQIEAKRLRATPTYDQCNFESRE